MNIVKTPEQYNENYVFLCEPIKNNVMNDSSFIRIIYSTPNVILNGIYISFTLNNINCDNYYAKYRCWFNYDDHREMFDKINQIECGILQNANILHKTPQNKLCEQFKSGNINTVALPATGLFGAFFLATFSIIAASYCNGPSMIKSGRFCCASLVASATFSTSEPVPELPVE